jgi:2-keto-4-pentenoate hydratase/2-oxohepta-3-ene-1,7-dioic acid hydratase in catechol pathway
VKGSIFRRFQVEGKPIPISVVLLLAPVLPTKIVAIAANYKDHAKERGRPLPTEPMLFLKPPSCLIGPNDIIIYPDQSKRVDYEGELAVVIKKRAYKLTEDASISSYVLGYTCFNDVTARDLQDKDKRFTRGKSFDTFGAVGPCIETDVAPERLKLKTFLNGKLRQSANTGNMIFSIPFLIKYISQIMTLMPGDVITTGTPAGVGPMNPGDRVDVQIEGIGVLSNIVMKIK